MLELAILGLLYEAPEHGYELRKRLSVRLGGLRVISYGSLYPALRRLTRAGLIAEETGPPAEGTWSRRGRRGLPTPGGGEGGVAGVPPGAGPPGVGDRRLGGPPAL